MIVNADRSVRAVVDTQSASWVSSPEPGVERIMLERDGDEVARATSIVRYAPGSRFAAHVHDLGEEFLVLQGEFRDEYGIYPAGTYVRNPRGSRHAPFSPAGTVLFVKLRQLGADERERTVVADAIARARLGGGELVLYEDAHERVALVQWPRGHAPGARRFDRTTEIYVLEGDFRDEHGGYRSGTWIRQPQGSSHAPTTDYGCGLWMKSSA